MELPNKYKGATAKPWKVFGQNDEHDLSVDADELHGCLTSQAIGPEGDEPVCIVVTKGYGPSTDRRHDANALLIADAPFLACRVAALEGALTDMLGGWRYIRQHHGDLYGVGWDRAQMKAEKALAVVQMPDTAGTLALNGERG